MDYPHPERQQSAVDAFWRWWEVGGERLAKMFRGDIEQDEETIRELNERILDIAPGLIFEFSSGTDSEFVFTLTAEGVAEFRGPTRRWLMAAPEADSVWTFTDVRLPKEDFVVQMGEVDAAAADLRFTIERGQSSLDLEVYHPALTGPNPEQLGFVLLDNALGEANVELWVGAVRFTSDPGPDLLLSDVKAAVAELEEKFPLDGEGRWVVFESDQGGEHYVGRSRAPLRPLSAPLLDVHVRIDVGGVEKEEQLIELEDRLVLAIDEVAAEMSVSEDLVARLVAVETFSGVRAFHVYAAATTGIVEKLQVVSKAYGEDVRGEGVVDPGWTRVAHLRF